MHVLATTTFTRGTNLLHICHIFMIAKLVKCIQRHRHETRHKLRIFVNDFWLGCNRDTFELIVLDLHTNEFFEKEPESIPKLASGNLKRLKICSRTDSKVHVSF